MPHDAFDPGDVDTRPYPFPYHPRTLTGEPMLAGAGDDLTPRPGILNGRVYHNVVPMPTGTRIHRRPYEATTYARRIELTIPDVPALTPEQLTEVDGL